MFVIQVSAMGSCILSGNIAISIRAYHCWWRWCQQSSYLKLKMSIASEDHLLPWQSFYLRRRLHLLFPLIFGLHELLRIHCNEAYVFSRIPIVSLKIRNKFPITIIIMQAIRTYFLNPLFLHRPYCRYRRHRLLRIWKLLYSIWKERKNELYN